VGQFIWRDRECLVNTVTSKRREVGSDGVYWPKKDGTIILKH